MVARRGYARRRRKAQSIVEFALGGIFLALVLAAATDIGRAYFTYIAVDQMAGEGAQYLADYPDADRLLDGSLPPNASFQERARNVAVRALGGIINPANVDLPSGGNPGDVFTSTDQADRCVNTQFQVTVAYHMNDLFFPALLGFSNLTIGATATNTFQQSTTHSPNNCSGS